MGPDKIERVDAYLLISRHDRHEDNHSSAEQRDNDAMNLFSPP